MALKEIARVIEGCAASGKPPNMEAVVQLVSGMAEHLLPNQLLLVLMGDSIGVAQSEPLKTGFIKIMLEDNPHLCKKVIFHGNVVVIDKEIYDEVNKEIAAMSQNENSISAGSYRSVD